MGAPPHMPKPSIMRARQLRQSMTDAEQRLWGALKQDQMLGFRFRRQQTLGPYIVDFVCLRALLVIECDGGQHLDSARDQKRDAWLRDEGFTVMRFWNDQVLHETNAVLQVIFDWLNRGAGTPTPTLPPEGGGSSRTAPASTLPSPFWGEGQGGGTGGRKTP